LGRGIYCGMLFKTMLKTSELCPHCTPSQAQYTFERTIFRLRIIVSSNEFSFIRWLRFHLSGGDCVREGDSNADEGAVTKNYHVHISKEGSDNDDAHRIIGPDDPVVQSRSWGHLQAHMERAITRAARRYCAPYHVVHAGAIARNGRAVLLPASPGSGKSTLVTALALSGFEYYTDEVAVLTEEGRLLPYPKAITLKRSGWEVIMAHFPQACSAAYSPVHHEKLRHVAAPKLPAPSVTETGCQVDFVVFPRYAPDEITSLQPISRSAALVQLAERSLNLFLLGKEGFDVIYGVVKHAKSYDLVTNDVTKAVQLLEGLLDEAPKVEQTKV